MASRLIIDVPGSLMYNIDYVRESFLISFVGRC